MKQNLPVLGIDVGGQNIKAGLVNEEVISNFHCVSHKAENVVPELLKVISLFNITQDTIIGVGFPGFVGDGMVMNPPNLPIIKQIDLERLLREKTNSPVYILNDADACILGEAIYGAGKGFKVVAGFTLGTGVGGGLVIDREIYIGSNGFASEFGHITINPSGPICNCGKRGCLESFLGAYHIIRRYKTLGGESDSVKDIFKRASSGEPIALEVVNEFGFYLSIGIMNIIEILDPDVVVLAGGISKSGEQILKAIRDNIPFLMRFPKDPEIKLCELGDRAGPIGAAYWARMQHR